MRLFLALLCVPALALAQGVQRGPLAAIRTAGKAIQGKRGTCTQLAAATNIALWSEQIDAAWWSKGNGNSVTPNTDIAPDGTLSGDTVVRGSGGGNSIVTGSFTGTAAPWTYSVHLKAGTTAVAEIGFLNGTWAAWTAAIVSGPGSLSAATGAAGTRVTVSGLSTSEWTRVGVTATLTAAAGWTANLYPQTSGSGTAGLTQRMWGGQIESGAIATPYIKTEATSVTRPAGCY